MRHLFGIAVALVLIVPGCTQAGDTDGMMKWQT